MVTETDDEPDIVSCSNCGKPFAEGGEPNITSDNKTLCDFCYDFRFHGCHTCERIIDRDNDDYHTAYNGSELVCQGCFEDYYFYCDNCGDCKSVDEAYAFQHNESTWCERCCDYYAYWCDHCDERHQEGYECRPSRLIQGYCYRPDPIFRFYTSEDKYSFSYHEGDGKGQTFMGFELEVENYSATISDGANVFEELLEERLLYLKDDGSLSDGFEIVTHPCTLTYYHRHKDRWADPIAELLRLGYRSWNTSTCGMHIHVSRRAFKNKAHLWRFAYFMNSNPLPLQRLAGRKSDQWASFEGQKGEASKIIAGKKSYPNSRYVAVNLSNRDTVEIRIFRGSLLPRRIMSNLALVDSVVEYTRNMSVKEVNDAMSWGDYEKYVRNLEHPMYADLQYYIKHYFGLGESTEVTQEG